MDVDDQRIGRWTTLGIEHPPNCIRVARIRSEPVDRFRRKGDQAASAKCRASHAEDRQVRADRVDHYHAGRHIDHTDAPGDSCLRQVYQGRGIWGNACPAGWVCGKTKGDPPEWLSPKLSAGLNGFP